MSLKNHTAYSDKFVLSVLNLSRIDLAAEEDEAYAIDYWARLFKAEIWEELKELIKDNEYLREAADSIYKANADDIVRQQCRAREEAERRERTLERDIKILEEKNAGLEDEILSLREEIERLKQELNTK